MSSLVVKPTSTSPSPSPQIFSFRSRLFSSVSIPRKTNRRCVLGTRAYNSSDYTNSGTGDSKPPTGNVVVDAMRQTLTNMIGTLLPQFLAVTVTTVAENLAQLMYSVMRTGYMFRNAQYRLELQESLEQVALPDVEEKKYLRLCILNGKGKGADLDLARRSSVGFFSGASFFLYDTGEHVSQNISLSHGS